jgi:hypothetical protein
VAGLRTADSLIRLSHGQVRRSAYGQLLYTEALRVRVEVCLERVFGMQLFEGVRIQLDMSTTTLPISKDKETQ